MKLITLIDDIDASTEDVKTVFYAFDGEAYEIDLNAMNAEDLRSLMAPYIAVSRKTTKSALMKSLPTKRKTPALPAERTRKEVVKETIRQQAPLPPQGLESQSIPEPTGTQVTPLESEPLDSKDPTDEVPQDWRPCMPLPGETRSEQAQKVIMWRTLMGMQIEPVNDKLIADWLTFYSKKVWALPAGS